MESNNILFFVVSFRRKNSSSLEKFQMRIRKRELYPKDDKYVDRVITDMVKLPILHVGKFIHEWELVYCLRHLSKNPLKIQHYVGVGQSFGLLIQVTYVQVTYDGRILGGQLPLVIKQVKHKWY